MPGEFCQHDFGHVDVRFVDGTRKRIHFFGSRLKWSRWTEVAIDENEQTETLVRTLVAHYERVGGVPLMGVFDRPKTIAIEWDKTGRVTQWYQTFLQDGDEQLHAVLGIDADQPYSKQLERPCGPTTRTISCTGDICCTKRAGCTKRAALSSSLDFEGCCSPPKSLSCACPADAERRVCSLPRSRKHCLLPERKRCTLARAL